MKPSHRCDYPSTEPDQPLGVESWVIAVFGWRCLFLPHLGLMCAGRLTLLFFRFDNWVKRIKKTIYTTHPFGSATSGGCSVPINV
jgi:hypothetical protein